MYKKLYIYSNRDKKFTGEMYLHSTKSYAIRYPGCLGPVTLFGIFEQLERVEHERVMHFIRERVTPPTRDGIEDILRSLGMTHYDPVELFIRTNGRCFEDSYIFLETA